MSKDELKYFIVGKIFNLAIGEGFPGLAAAQERLEELCAAANELAEANPVYKRLRDTAFALDREREPRAIINNQTGTYTVIIQDRAGQITCF